MLSKWADTDAEADADARLMLILMLMAVSKFSPGVQNVKSFSYVE